MTDWAPEAYAAGLVDSTLSPHTSRTLMLENLRALLAACPPLADRAAYRGVVVDENALLKPTMFTRKRSFKLLAQLYGLDPSLLLFRALRELWDEAGEVGQPLVALLCALARDAAFRATAPIVLDAEQGTHVEPEELAREVEKTYPGRYTTNTLDSLGRNAASSWTQSGHLEGFRQKVRARAAATPASTTYAVLLGHLTGARGDGLFTTAWARALDAPEHVLREHAAAAGRRGWLEYRSSAGVTEVTFRHLLRPLHGTREAVTSA